MIFSIWPDSKAMVKNLEHSAIVMNAYIIFKTSGLYYKHVMIVNDASSGVNK